VDRDELRVLYVPKEPLPRELVSDLLYYAFSLLDRDPKPRSDLYFVLP
jgi:hypothetical protein